MSLYLVTGAAGFIGYHLCERLLQRGDTVVGLDNMNNYYDVRLKEAWLARLQSNPWFTFIKQDIADREGMEDVLAGHTFDVVVNLGLRPRRGGTGGSSIFTHESPRIRGREHYRIPQRA